MNNQQFTSEKILANAVLGLEKWENGQTNIDDYVNFHLPDPELRRSVSSLLFEYFRHKTLIDKLISSLLQTPCKPHFRRIIAAAATQILYQDGIAPASAVNIAVDLVKKSPQQRAAGFVNAVLRNIVRTDFEQFSAKLSPAERSFLPPPVYEHWKNIFPEHLDQLCGLLQQRAILAFRACGEPLTGAEIEDLEATPIPSEGFHFYRSDNTSQVVTGNSLKTGRIYIQDAATALAPTLAALQPGEHAADVCAAPGGKTLMLAEQLKGSGSLVVADRSATRQKLTARNLELRGYQYRPIVASILESPFEKESFDAVLLDVPCSNTGVFHRRPDVLWSFSAKKVEELTALQMNILNATIRLIKPGGRIIYSTCSIEPTENSLLVRRFLAEHPEFELRREKQLMPQSLHDGAYAAVLFRR